MGWLVAVSVLAQSTQVSVDATVEPDCVCPVSAMVCGVLARLV